MSDEIPEVPSVEEQADQVLRAELTKLRSGEACIEGDTCPIHHRQDCDMMDSGEGYGRLVNYVGEYVVITADNPEWDKPTVILRAVLGMLTKDNAPDKYETCVLHVGDGSVGDLYSLDQEGRNNAIRYLRTHSDWDGFRDQHESILTGVREGTLDVSKPVKEV